MVIFAAVNNMSDEETLYLSEDSHRLCCRFVCFLYRIIVYIQLYTFCRNTVYVERYVSVRSGLIIRFMFDVLGVEYAEKMVILGNTDALPDYERMIRLTKIDVDRLKLLVD